MDGETKEDDPATEFFDKNILASTKRWNLKKLKIKKSKTFYI